MSVRRVLMLAALMMSWGVVWPRELPAETDFRRDVQPILAEHCFKCHGADEKTREGNLRLDLREAALKGGDSQAPAIAAGKPEKSALLARITSGDPDAVMPPPREKKPLNAAQIETLRRWIGDGANYVRHWSFEPPVKASVTAGENPIDSLVRRKLQTLGLPPSPPAEPHVLCRRLHLDLIGLPPSPAEIDAFVAEANRDLPGAVDALATKLLASERYGEKWARVWLDVARYSDSNGFEKDLPREQWAWRDWVLGAINRDMPFDRFLVEQIAGDLLPDATQEQIIATGFLRNGMINEEGAIVPEQFRMEGLFDRIDCLGKAALGLSLQCAQCHSHKFDPISHVEYYGMFAFLNNSFEAQSWVYTAEQQQQIERIKKGLAEIDERLKKDRPKWEQEATAWEQGIVQGQLPWKVMSPTELLSRSGLNHPTRLDDDSVLTMGHPSTASDIFIIGQPPLAGVTGLRLEALPHGDLPCGGPGFSKLGVWALTEMEVHTQLPGAKEWVQQKLTAATADFAEPDHRIEEFWQSSADKDRNRKVGPAAYMIDGSDSTAFRADRGPGRRNAESAAAVQFATPLSLPAGTKLRVMLRTNHGGDSSRLNVMLGRCRISLTDAPDPRLPAVDYAAILAMQTPPEKRTPRQRETVFAAWRNSVDDAKKFRDEAEKLWKQHPDGQTTVLHLAERRDDLVRTTYLLDRGTWDRPRGEAVRPHVLAALHPYSESSQADRLSLARWLTDKKSPLTARVQVNRVWQIVFGSGLVETAEDFGARTPEPEHRELLDWLAVDFMESDWSQKQLLRTIVASRTYQQTSTATPALLERDSRNSLLARGPRFRVDAEVVRDIALAASGLLHQQLGGPSVFPPVPESVLDYNFSRPGYWKPPLDEQRYRRSLYTFRKRSMPDPVMSAFDAPNGDSSCARRPRSNTPLAALASLNETIFVEAAQALALRTLKEGGESDADRANYAFRLCTGRLPGSPEREAILDRLAADLTRLRRGELKANDIAFSTLTKPANLPSDATPNQIAAWTLTARVLLNLDETLSKN